MFQEIEMSDSNQNVQSNNNKGKDGEGSPIPPEHIHSNSKCTFSTLWIQEIRDGSSRSA